MTVPAFYKSKGDIGKVPADGEIYPAEKEICATEV